MNLTRSLTGLLALTLAAPLALAQAAQRGTTNALPGELQSVYQQVRPQVVRIEDCPDTACQDPDGIGTAFVISKDGLALTAYHVMFDSKNATAVTVDKKRYPVTVVGYDDQADLALIRIKFPTDVKSLALAPLAPKPGEQVFAVGNGGGAFLRPKAGKLLKLDTPSDRADFPSGTLQMSAQLIPGDSGGPIFNARGEVEGVVSYIKVDGSNTIVSYAVPVTATSALVKDLRAGIKRDAPVVGLNFPPYEFKPELFPKLGLGPKAGAVFQGVQKGSPADKAGLRPVVMVQPPATQDDLPVLKGDVITAVNGKPVDGYITFLAAIRSYKVGDTVTLAVQRGDQNVDVKLTLASHAAVFGALAQKP